MRLLDFCLSAPVHPNNINPMNVISRNGHIAVMSEAFQAASQPCRTTLTFAPALSVIAIIGCTPAVATTMPKLSKVPDLNLDSRAVNVGQRRVTIYRAAVQIGTADLLQLTDGLTTGPAR
jgi:hypothetical protein